MIDASRRATDPDPDDYLQRIRGLLQEVATTTDPREKARLKETIADIGDEWARTSGTVVASDATREQVAAVARKLAIEHRPRRVVHVGWIGSAVSRALADTGACVLSLLAHRGQAIADKIRYPHPNLTYHFLHDRFDAAAWLGQCDLVVIEVRGGHPLVQAPRLSSLATDDATWVLLGDHQQPVRGLRPVDTEARASSPPGSITATCYRRDASADEAGPGPKPQKSRDELVAEARAGAEGICDELVDDFIGAYLHAAHIPGWLAPNEAARLYLLGRTAEGHVVEVGTYFGKSAFLIGLGLKQAGRGKQLITIDVHWRGEDPETGKPRVLAHDSQLAVGSMIKQHDLSDVVIQMIGWSHTCLSHLDFREVAAVFIDGGHDYKSCRDDFLAVQRHLPADTTIDLLFHDCVPSFPGVQRAIEEFCDTDPRFLRKQLVKSLLVARYGAEVAH